MMPELQKGVGDAVRGNEFVKFSAKRQPPAVTVGMLHLSTTMMVRR
jgi:hypothetical protein